MNKKFALEALSLSLIPIYVLCIIIIHPYISNTLAIIAFIIIAITQITLTNRESYKNKDVTQPGLIIAAIAAPFIITGASCVLFLTLYGIEYVGNIISSNLMLTILFLVILLVWVAQLLVLAKNATPNN